MKFESESVCDLRGERETSSNGGDFKRNIRNAHLSHFNPSNKTHGFCGREREREREIERKREREREGMRGEERERGRGC